MNILITGGAGFIGSHLVDALSKEKSNNVTILDNFHSGNTNNIRSHVKNKKIKIINNDIRDYNSFKRIGSIDCIYHLAAQSNVSGSYFEPDYAFSSNVNGTYNILKYASKNKIKRFIFASSREVYGNPKYLPVNEKHPLNPINIYGATKVCGEVFCNTFSKLYGLKITILRIANVYGHRDKDRVIPIFLRNAKINKDLKLFGGRQVLDFIWIGDVIKSIIDISKDDKFIGETINIGTGVGTSIESLAKTIIKLTDSRSRIIYKKPRNFDVEKFTAKSDKIKLKTMKLADGLKKMLSLN